MEVKTVEGLRSGKSFDEDKSSQEMDYVSRNMQLKTSIPHQTNFKINYKTDQWNPLNPGGKRVYDRDFLLQLQKIPSSLTKPSNLPTLGIIKNRPIIQRLPKRIHEEDKISQFDRDPRKLFIGGITHTTLETALEDHFGQYGEILECVIMRHFWNFTPRYFGFVIYKESWMAEAAMQVEEHKVDGRFVEIRRATPADPRLNHKQNDEYGDWRSRIPESDGCHTDQEISKIENLKGIETFRSPSVTSKFFERKFPDTSKIGTGDIGSNRMYGNTNLLRENFKLHHDISRSQLREDDKPNKVINISLTEAITLHEAENAWKPINKQRLDRRQNNSSQETLKMVRSILNKLTPKKFDKLVMQVKSLDIDNEEKLVGVIDLLFEKAIEESNYSILYASMCKELTTLNVPLSEGESRINFRRLLITKCQREFEQEILIREENGKKRSQQEHEEEENKYRRRQLGNIRFIGELFKLGLLIEPIMHECVTILLTQGDEDSLECLCRFLTTIGKKLVTKKETESDEDFDLKNDVMDNYMAAMQKVIDMKQTSSRTRFMLQDLIDLKKRNWMPRKNQNNVKPIDQMYEDAEKDTTTAIISKYVPHSNYR